MSVSWPAPDDWGGSLASAQYVLRYAEATTFAEITSMVVLVSDEDALASASATLVGLRASTGYVVSVAARTAAGASHDSAWSAAFTTLAARLPGAPVPPTVSTVGPSSVALAWAEVADDGGSPVLSFWVHVSDTGGGNEFAVALAGPELSTTIASLSASSSYSFRVAAMNAVGMSVYSKPVVGETAAAVPPSAPVDVALSVTGPTSVSVSWFPPSDTGGAPVTTYTVTVLHAADGTVAATVAATESPAAVTGLEVSTSYVARVNATNVAGPGAPSVNSSAVTTGATVAPDCPVVSAPIVGAGSVSVSWTPGASDGGAAVSGFDVTATPSAGVATRVVVGAGVSQTLVTGLAADSSYTLLVRALNSAGSSTGCATTAVTTTAATVPGAPTGIAASTATASTMEVSWTAPNVTGGVPLVGYHVECATGGVWSPQACLTTDSASTSGTVTGLAASTPYTFRVIALNGVGAGNASSPSAPVSTTAVAAPTAPQSVRPVSGGSSWAAFQWALPASTGGSAIASFQLQLKRLASDDSHHDVASTTVAGLSHTFRNLTASTFYFVEVVAVNGAGLSSPAAASSLIKTSPPLPPGVPESVVASNATSSRVVLTWTVPADSGGVAITHYLVYIAAVTASGHRVAEATPVVATPASSGDSSSVVYQVQGLLAQTTYVFSVSAVNAAGEGRSSHDTDAVTTLPPVPPSSPGTPTVVATAPSSLRVQWALPSDNGGAPVLSFVVLLSSNRTGTCVLRNCSVTTVSFADAVASGDSVATTELVDLFAGTAYFVAVRASNLGGDGPASGTSTAITTAAAGRSSPPLRVQPIAVTASTLDVRWAMPEDFGGSPAVAFRVYAGMDAAKLGPGFPSTSVMQETDGPVTEYRITGLLGNTQYVWVRSV